MPNAAPLRRGDVASARFGPDSGNDMRQAIARTRAMCSAWADAFGIWATAIEPYSTEMIYRNGKVNRLPLPLDHSELRPQPIGNPACYLCRRFVGHREYRTDVDFAKHVAIGPIGVGWAEHEIR